MGKITEDDFREITFFLQDNDSEAAEAYCAEHKIDIEKSLDESGHTIFTRIMLFPNTAPKFAKMLIDLDVNPNVQNADGDTPLHVACMKGCTEAIDYLIGEDVELNLLNKKGKTPLRIASETEHGLESLMKKDAYM